MQPGLNAIWSEPPRSHPLGDHDVHVWLADLRSARCHRDSFRAVLTRDEVSRAEKFHFAEHRERWEMTRGLLRLLLASYVEVTAHEIAFQYGPHGKPELKDTANCALHFNTSHSVDYAVFAVTRAGEVGVDIEGVRPEMPRRDDIVRRYFAPEEQKEWLAVPESERARAFFKLWTRKEAFVKARGVGLFAGLETFAVSLQLPRVLRSNEDATGANWWMSELPALPGCEGALVVRAASCAPRFWNWPLKTAS